MVDVTDTNFEEVFPKFEYNLRKCSFVALDCEFSSLPLDEDIKSFQDSASDRYKKIHRGIHKCFPLQVGLAPFTYDRDLTKYKATVYKFNIFPKFFGPYDLKVHFKSSTVQFLKTYNFDFNKAQSKLVAEDIENGTLTDNIFNVMTFDEKEALASHYETINKWLHHKSREGSLTIDVGANNPHFKYYMHKEIRRGFKNVWTYHSSINSYEITVKQVSDEERLSLQSTLDGTLGDELLTSLRGFSRVMDVLIASKKPIVGHNMFLDLLSCYHFYYDNLPSDYKTFKRNINSLFPIVYDTKFISNEMKRMDFRDVLDNISLQNLYATFKDTERCIFKPDISFEYGIYDGAQVSHLHDAGWDAYITGFCFLKMMNLLNANGEKTFVAYSNKELMTTAERFKNRLNIARAFIPYLRLDGPDPSSTRPPHLVIICKRKDRLNLAHLNSLLLDVGNFEVKPLSNYSAVIAALNYSSYRGIIKKMSSMEEFRLEKYSFLRHHAWVRPLFAVGLALPTGLTLWHYFRS